MQYLKHYWIHAHSGTYCCEDNPVEKRHPEKEFPGLDVRIWMHDENGIDVCLSAVPDGVTITDVVDDHNGKKVVQKLTEAEFNSVQTPLTESQTLRQEAQQETDETIKAEKEAAADAKFEEARQALFAL
jgi:hypothetical protein